MFSCIVHGWDSHDSSCPECHKTVTITTTEVTTGEPESQPSSDQIAGMKEALVKQLREANPYQDNYAPHNFRAERGMAWEEAADKLQELINKNHD